MKKRFRPERGRPTRVNEGVPERQSSGSPTVRETGGSSAGSGSARVSPWEAFVRASRRDLYLLFLESERLAHEVVESLPDEGMRRVLRIPVDADIASIRARLAKQIDEKRALLNPFRGGSREASVAEAARRIADAWAEADAGQETQQRQA